MIMIYDDTLLLSTDELSHGYRSSKFFFLRRKSEENNQKQQETT